MGWLDVLGWVGSALLIYSLMQARVLRFRLLNLVACVVLVIFNAVLGIWPMVAMNVVLSGINLWFIRKLASERHSDVAFEVAVRPDNHRNGTRRLNPLMYKFQLNCCTFGIWT